MAKQHVAPSNIALGILAPPASGQPTNGRKPGGRRGPPISRVPCRCLTRFPPLSVKVRDGRWRPNVWRSICPNAISGADKRPIDNPQFSNMFLCLEHPPNAIATQASAGFSAYRAHCTAFIVRPRDVLRCLRAKHQSRRPPDHRRDRPRCAYPRAISPGTSKPRRADYGTKWMVALLPKLPLTRARKL
jgi:hypothetical protein